MVTGSDKGKHVEFIPELMSKQQREDLGGVTDLVLEAMTVRCALSGKDVNGRKIYIGTTADEIRPVES